jgi:small-conductance mechanosensitive channel
MLLQAQTTNSEAVEGVIAEFFTDIVASIPNLLSALVFLVIAYVSIALIRTILRAILSRAYSEDQQLIVDLKLTLVSIVLWFGAALAVLKIVGMGEVAASLGTASGFIALGIAFALNDMIADTVAGVYLLRDADFNPGDRITTASVTGTVTQIDLRKTRLETDDGDLVVLANSDVEPKWTQERSPRE